MAALCLFGQRAIAEPMSRLLYEEQVSAHAHTERALGSSTQTLLCWIRILP